MPPSSHPAQPRVSHGVRHPLGTRGAHGGDGAGYGAAVHIEVIVNQGAGSVDSDDTEAERRRIIESFARHGLDVRVAAVSGMAVGLAVRSAADRGADVVVVGGGDGTLGSAADALSGADAALGILARGTFNHFAKDLQLPLELDDAVDVIVTGETKAIDVAEVNGRTFVNNSSIGLYPVMVDLRDRIRRERGWGKVRSVPVASWQVLRRFPTRRLHITVDGHEWERRSPFVFIGNNHYDVGPRGVGARTDLDEGILSCYVARAATRLGFVKLALKGVFRGAARTPELDRASGPEVTVEAGTHRMLVAIDGEVDTLRSPLTYTLRAGALKVRVPAHTDPPPGPPEGPEAESGAHG